MNQQFLKEIEKGSKSALVKKRIITHYIYNGSSTIPDLSKELDLSVPTVTKFIGEMCDDGYINDYGKLETSGGRHPNLYGLNPESGYFLGVDIKRLDVYKRQFYTFLDIIPQIHFNNLYYVEYHQSFRFLKTKTYCIGYIGFMI